MKIILLILILPRVILMPRGSSCAWRFSRSSSLRVVFRMTGCDIVTVVPGWNTRGVFWLVRRTFPTVRGWGRCVPSIQWFIRAYSLYLRIVLSVKRAVVCARWKTESRLPAPWALSCFRRSGYLRVVIGRTRMIGSVFVLYRRRCFHWGWRQRSVAQSKPRSLNRGGHAVHIVKGRGRWWRTTASGKWLEKTKVEQRSEKLMHLHEQWTCSSGNRVQR